MIQSLVVATNLMDGLGAFGAQAKPMDGNESLLFLNGAALFEFPSILRRPLALFLLPPPNGVGLSHDKVKIILATRELAGEVRVINERDENGAPIDRTEEFMAWASKTYVLSDGEEFYLSARNSGKDLMIRSLAVRNLDPQSFADLFLVQESGWALMGACQARAIWGVTEPDAEAIPAMGADGEETFEAEAKIEYAFEPVVRWDANSGPGGLLEPFHNGCENVVIQIQVVPGGVMTPLREAAECDLDDVLVCLVAEPMLVGVARDTGGPEANNVLSDQPVRLLNDSLNRHSATARQIGVGLYNNFAAQFPVGEVPDVPETLQAAAELGYLGLDVLIRGDIRQFMEDSKGIHMKQAELYAEWLVGTLSANPEVGTGTVRQIVAERKEGDDLSLQAELLSEGDVQLTVVRRDGAGTITERVPLSQ